MARVISVLDLEHITLPHVGVMYRNHPYCFCFPLVKDNIMLVLLACTLGVGVDRLWFGDTEISAYGRFTHHTLALPPEGPAGITMRMRRCGDVETSNCSGSFTICLRD